MENHNIIIINIAICCSNMDIRIVAKLKSWFTSASLQYYCFCIGQTCVGQIRQNHILSGGTFPYRPYKGVTLCIVLPNSRASCVSLTSANLRHQSHASRTISHAWLINPDKLFFNTWLITKVQFNFPENICGLTVPQSSKIFPSEIASEEVKGGWNIFRLFQQCSEVFRKSSEIFGSCWGVFRNSCYDKMLTLKKSTGI